MRKLKTHLWACVAFVGLGATPAAHAGVPVIDVAGLIQSIMEVLNSVTEIANQVTQIENQVSQLEQQAEQFESMTGARNLGNILNNPALQNYLPTDVVNSYDSLAGGYSALTGLSKELRDAELIYNCLEVAAGAARNRCQQRYAKPYQQRAAMQRGIEASNSRVDQIEQLMDRINTTQDPKEIAELQARIEAENALLQHETNRVLLMQGVYAADARAQENSYEEIRMQSVLRNGNILDQVPQP